MTSNSFFDRAVRQPTCCLLISIVLVVAPSMMTYGQAPVEPEQERLLNGLKILIWSRPGDADVLLKLRIHSGAAFDLAGKSGGMVVLGDILFPDQATHEYFTEEMQGRLNVTTDYDAITITMQGHANEFAKIVEILRNALLATPLSAENVSSIREGRIKIVKETSISPAVLADRAIARRLFGDFPYGLPYSGSVESLSRLDRADLMLARDRFLNPNNATLAIVGGVQANQVMKVLRQRLGSWRKSEEIVPSTFRQPSAPEPKTLLVNAPSDQSVEIRVAMRGLSRSDRNAGAATILAGVARQRWERLVPELTRAPMFVRHEPRMLPGMFVMGATVNNNLAAKTLAAAKEVLRNLVTKPASAEELEQARGEALVVATKGLSQPDGMTNAWLDIDTYHLHSINEQISALRTVSANDLQQLAASLFGKGAFAVVAVGNSEQLKKELGRDAPVELLGEVPPETRSTDSKPTTIVTKPIKPD